MERTKNTSVGVKRRRKRRRSPRRWSLISWAGDGVDPFASGGSGDEFVEPTLTGGFLFGTDDFEESEAAIARRLSGEECPRFFVGPKLAFESRGQFGLNFGFEG